MSVARLIQVSPAATVVGGLVGNSVGVDLELNVGDGSDVGIAEGSSVFVAVSTSDVDEKIAAGWLLNTTVS